MPNTILIRGNPVQGEAQGNGVVTPGDLLGWSSGKVDQHATAGGNGITMVAIEEGFVGDGIDDTYADGENVVFVIPRRGDKLYMWLADGENASLDSPLESDGLGALQVHTPQAVDEGGVATYTVYADAIKFYAAEALDNSAGGQRNRITVIAA